MSKQRDWIGNKKSTFVTLGASSHSAGEREENDYYATDPIASAMLMDIEELSDTIVDNSFGQGHLMLPFQFEYRTIIAFDIEKRQFLEQYNDNPLLNFCKEDFLSVSKIPSNADIVCNPPYSKALEFAEHSLNLLGEGRKLCMFLKLTFLEGKKRKEFFEKHPPIRVWVSSSRIKCAKNGDFDATGSSASAYAWFVWEKGYKGNTTIKWFN